MIPKVTVIIPTFNRADVLARAIESVFAQTFRGFELIVVDDGSTDHTQEVLSRFKDWGPLSVYMTENKGVSAARNFALSKALGQWVAFLDSDDEWFPEKLEKQMEWVIAHPEHPLVHGEEIWIRKGVRVNPMKKHQKKGGDVFCDAVRLCCISPSTVLMKKCLFKEFGCFNEDYPVCEDYDLWLKITSKYEVGYISDPLIKKYGGHEDQLSRRYVAMDYWRVQSLRQLLQNPELDESKRAIAEEELKKKSDILLKGYRKHENFEKFDEVFRWRKTGLEIS